MRTLRAGLLMMMFAIAAGRACVAPSNIEGVAFTNDEKINLEVLKNLGVEGENYMLDSQQENEAVCYLSHYDERAVVYVGTYGMSYQQDMPLSCMGVILNQEFLEDIYQSPPTDLFDFAEAVKTELVWLVENGIVELSQERIGEIDSALSESLNGGMQYWTGQKRALAYNSWFVYDEQQGVWGSDGGGVRNPVESVNGVKGCSVVSPQFDRPSAPIVGAVLIAPVNPRGERSVASAHLLQKAHGSVVLRFDGPVTRARAARVVAMSGRVMGRFTIPAGVREYRMDDISSSPLGLSSYVLEIDGIPQRLRFIPVNR